MHLGAPLAALVVLLVLPTALAQGGPGALELALTPPGMTLVPANGALEVQVAWEVTYPAAVGFPTAQAMDVRIAWDPSCPLLSATPEPTPVEPTPGEQVVRGSTSFTLDATRGRGGDKFACRIVGVVSDGAGQDADEAEVSFTAAVAYDGNVTVRVADASRQAGPQKQVPYPFEVTNHGNGRTVVAFEVVDRPDGGLRGWHILVPDAVVLDPGQSATLIATVATPFENGYVRGDSDFTLRAVPSNAQDPEQTGPPVEVALHAQVKGWHVPGPGAALLLAALAGAAVVARRR